MKKKKGFTLIELLVAMGIIAVLVTLSIVAIGIVQRSLRNTQRRDVLNTVNIWVASYFERNQQYPATADIDFESDAVYFDFNGTDEETIIELSGATSAEGSTDSDVTQYCYASNSTGGAFILKSGIEPSGEEVIEDNDGTVSCTLPTT